MTSSLELGPITRALMRNKLGVVLIALQIAFTMTVIVNAIDIIHDRTLKITSPTGMEEDDIFSIRSFGFDSSINAQVLIDEDLDMIRQLPGVVDASRVNAVPASGSGSSSGYAIEPGRRELTVPAAQYSVDEHALNTMGLTLVAGRDFTPEDVRRRTATETRSADQIIVSLALAEEMFPGEGLQAVGRTIYSAEDKPLRIIGIVERLQSPWPNATDWIVERSLMIPDVVIDNSSIYLVRTVPGQRDALMADVEERLAGAGYDRILMNNKSVAQMRTELYRMDTAMARVLYTVIGTLIFITALGIIGLAVFSINKRRKQIGTRRALGATRGGILRYLLVENLLISAAGVLFGAVLTIGFNIFLVRTFDIPRLDWYYAPLGMLVLLLLGQMAALGPAVNASRVAPAQAISPSH
ncbi:MAG: ABC transporter permease [Pseudomonadales bacterium]|nr:ABC transporter permease [Pseudomonadales bacterium]MCP5345197.1 ABC transporter permease [Pseudomonadales bacterium]MCP5358611.1 ABC transporter permease [Pseudomonadales bacterium]